MKKKGFTIIEVVLVLAIGGLIFLMVFIALPALQRSQRNTQRGDDVSRVATAVIDYQSNNSGKTPMEANIAGEFLRRYVDPDVYWKYEGTDYRRVTECGDQFRDPDGECYQFYWPYGTKGILGRGQNHTPSYHKNGNFNHTIYIWAYAECDDLEGTLNEASGKRNFAMTYIMEGGSVYCVDNS